MKRYLYCLLALFCLVSCHKEANFVDVPTDQIEKYEGVNKGFVLGPQIKKFQAEEFICKILAPDGNLIERRAFQQKWANADSSIISFDKGLKDGVYRIVSFAALEGETVKMQSKREFGLGIRVKFPYTDPSCIIDSIYNYDFELFGRGTADHPFIVACSDDLYKIRRITNNGDDNSLITNKTFFKQVVDIDLDYESFYCDAQYGWMPIGNDPITPFRGHYDGNGKKLTNLWCDRQNSVGIGLFGYIEGAEIENVVLENANIRGHSFVGGIAGATIVPGDLNNTMSLLTNCKVNASYVGHPSNNGSISVGGIIGAADQYSYLMIEDCEADSYTTVEGDYLVGGVLGGANVGSAIQLLKCDNAAMIQGNYSSVGGLVGAADSLNVIQCSNSGLVQGARKYTAGDTENRGYGTGGIVGGFNTCSIQATRNDGKVTGYQAVGGLAGGSCQVSEDTQGGGVMGDCYVNIVINTGAVEGKISAGGICGESQFGATNAVNKGNIRCFDASSNIGGIIAVASIAAIEATMNIGEVYTTSNAHTASGIVGLCNWASIAATENYGHINSKAEFSGGILGRSSTNTILNFCVNYGKISNSYDNAKVGGVVGEIGDPREWSQKDIFSIVLGSVEIVTAIVGAVVSVSGHVTHGSESVFEHITHAVHKIHTFADFILLGTDLYYTKQSVYHMITHDPEEVELASEEKERETNEQIEIFKAELLSSMEDYRLSYLKNPANFSFQYGLNNATLAEYGKNFTTVVNDFNSSQERKSNFADRMNEIRIERSEEIEKADHSAEIAHQVASGLCIVAGTLLTAAGIVVSVVSAGTCAPLVVGLMGAVVGLASGLNLITEGVMDFENNVVVLSQCGNTGEIYAPYAENVGGVVGYFHQTCEIIDSFNMGKQTSSVSPSAGIVGYLSSDAVIKRCVNYGTGWSDAIFHKGDGTITTHDNNYYYLVDNDGKTIGDSRPLKDFITPGALSNYDYTSEYARWKASETDQFFAMPYKSELQIKSTLKYE